MTDEVSIAATHVTRPSGRNHVWLAAPAAILVMGAVAQARLVDVPLSGFFYSFRMSQTALVVREFMRHGFDWRTPLPVFGHDSFVPMEFPLFQQLAAMLGTLLGWDAAIATRAMGIISFQLSAILAFWLARRWFGRITATVTLALFEFTAFGFFWGNAALIDFLAVALLLTAVLCVDIAATSDNSAPRAVASFGAVAFAIVAFLTKSTTGPVLAPLLFVPALNAWNARAGRDRLRPFIVPAAATGAALLASLAWTVMADRVKEANPWTAWLTSGALQEWNFGTLDQRTSFQVWFDIVHVSWGGIVGGYVAYLAIAVVAIVGWRWRPAVIVLALAPLIGPLVFMNLYSVHRYYSIAVYPLLVMLAGAAVGAFAKLSPRRRDKALIGGVGTAGICMVTWLSPLGGEYVSNLSAGHDVPDLAKRISTVVPQTNGVILSGCDWDPTIPFYSDRPAMMVRDEPGPRPTLADLVDFPFAAFCIAPPDGYDAELTKKLPPGVTWYALSDGIFALHPPAVAQP